MGWGRGGADKGKEEMGPVDGRIDGPWGGRTLGPGLGGVRPEVQRGRPGMIKLSAASPFSASAYIETPPVL